MKRKISFNLDVFKKVNGFVAILSLLGLMLLMNRYFPYFLHGPFGFGYDMGIYKKTFEEMTSMRGLVTSQIALLPSFLAYLFNLLHIPLAILLYHFHVFFSVLVAVPLFLLTKEYFGKREGVLVVALYSVSYVQVLASEFYLYKAMLGAIFLLFAFYFFARKSKWFDLAFVLLALTQLPQLLILLVGLGIGSLFNWKEYKKFYLRFLKFFGLVFLILLVFNFQHLLDAGRVIWLSLSGAKTQDAHLTGLFMSVDAFLHRAFFILILGGFGFVLATAKKNKKTLPVQVAVVFLALVVFLGLFFQNRFVEELDLLLMPFVAYFLIFVFDYIFKKRKIVDYVAGTLLIGLLAFLHYSYYKTTYPALSPHEGWAIDIVNQKNDSKYVMVTDTFYAPWLYGFSNKETLAPGIFESVWNFEQWVKFHGSSKEEQIVMLGEIAEKYGKYYLFMGRRQFNPGFDSANVKKIFDISGAIIYEVSPEVSSS